MRGFSVMYIIAYDISCNDNLRKVSKLLQKEGIRTQYSVFECELSQKDAKALFNKLIEIINESTDKLFFIPIDKNHREKIVRIGKETSKITGVY